MNAPRGVKFLTRTVDTPQPWIRGGPGSIPGGRIYMGIGKVDVEVARAFAMVLPTFPLNSQVGKREYIKNISIINNHKLLGDIYG